MLQEAFGVESVGRYVVSCPEAIVMSDSRGYHDRTLAWDDKLSSSVVGWQKELVVQIPDNQGICIKAEYLVEYTLEQWKSEQQMTIERAVVSLCCLQLFHDPRKDHLISVWIKNMYQHPCSRGILVASKPK